MITFKCEVCERRLEVHCCNFCGGAQQLALNADGKPGDEQINAAIELLRGAGYRVERPEWGPWESPKALRARLALDIGYSAFMKRLTTFPEHFPTHRGPTGRLTRLRSTPALEAHLLMPWMAGARTDLRDGGVRDKGRPVNFGRDPRHE